VTSTAARAVVMALWISAAAAARVSAVANVRTTIMAKSNFVIGSRPVHTHRLPEGDLECNSPYCDDMTAHPKDQENQRAPWKDK